MDQFIRHLRVGRIFWYALLPGILLLRVSIAGASGRETIAKFDILRPIEVSPPGADQDSVIFNENFEGGVGQWSSVDLTDPGPTWHPDAYNHYDSLSWWCGDAALVGYENNWLQYLVSPTIDLSTTTNPVLTCKVYWAIEPASPWGAYDGWDGANVWISLTGGNTWEVLEPDYPAYTSQSLYSFGWRWEMGPGIPGWAGYSGGWVSASFDLSAYTVANVKLRFAFCSDEATCTTNNPSLIGFFIDDIEVREGATVYLFNSAEGDPYPAEFTFATGDPSGDYWVLTEESYHSPTHSWNCDDSYFLSDALVSPPTSIPPGMSTQMSYWVYCDMPDVDGDNDDYLDDYYYIEVAPTGSAIWTPLIYDWAHNGSQLQWVERTDGYFEGIPTAAIDLTPWAGQEVQIRFRVVTDSNNDGGQGDGLFIDDVILTASILPDHDVGATRLMVPFPTYEGQDSITCSVDLANYGTSNQAQVPAFWNVNGDETPLIPWPQINAGQTVRRDFEWLPPATGVYDFMAYTRLTGDEVPANDTCTAGQVEVTPTGTFELGYDHRQITYLPDFYPFNFQTGTGPLVYFTPAADGIPGILDGDTLKAMFYSEGTFTLHIYAAGTPGNPGEEVYSQSVTIADSSNIYPNWSKTDISDVEYLQGGHPDFWVWLEITSADNKPHITGHLIDCFTPGHFFYYDGDEVSETIVNFNVRAILSGIVAVEPQVSKSNYTYSLLSNYPNPFNPTTTIRLNLPAPAKVQLTVFDLSGRRIVSLLNQPLKAGEHRVRWEAPDLPSGSYWLRLEAAGQSATIRTLLLK